jgi:hypothetical protein
LLATALFIRASQPLLADGGQKKTPESRSKALNPLVRNEGPASPNAKWSADPERGWVRAREQRQERHQKPSSHPRKGEGERKGMGVIQDY